MTAQDLANYPDSLKNGKAVIFEVTNDSLIQTVYLQALGEGKLSYYIVTKINNNFSARIEGTAFCKFISAGENGQHNQWGYKSLDGSYYFMIYNHSASEVEITRPILTSKPMKRITLNDNSFQR